jgi:hypothetical protein
MAGSTEASPFTRLQTWLAHCLDAAAGDNKTPGEKLISPSWMYAGQRGGTSSEELGAGGKHLY